MNYYERLESLGWTRTGGNSRYDNYSKGQWRVMVSKHIPNTGTGVHFWRVAK